MRSQRHLESRRPGLRRHRILRPLVSAQHHSQSHYGENLAVRPNGQILLSLVTAPQLWLVDRQQSGQAILVHGFPGSLALFGIAEYQPDVFAIIAGNFSLSTGPVVGSWTIWSIDLGGVNITSNSSVAAQPPRVTKIAELPTATSPNGMAVLSVGGKEFLIVGDVKTGVIYSVDIDAGTYAVAINNTFTAAGPEYAFGTAATDGVQVRDDVLYFDNMGQGKLFRVPMKASDGTPVGEFETVARILTPLDQWDDFTFDCEGNVFMAAGGANIIEKISLQGQVQVVAGNLNSTTLAEPTAAKFGRRKDDADLFYVTTAGGLVTPVDGNIITGGQVVAIKTESKGCY